MVLRNSDLLWLTSSQSYTAYYFDITELCVINWLKPSLKFKSGANKVSIFGLVAVANEIMQFSIQFIV